MFREWFEKFAKYTFKTRFIKLTKEFVEYLQQDSIILPSETPLENEPCFPELGKEIESAISDLGGSVFPKLNWSSPKDAAWIKFDSSLKCTTPEDVYLLLKSSDFIVSDLERNADVYYLGLREWFDLNPSMEFRCFVFEKQLIAISQRDILNYYDFLSDTKVEIQQKIQEFYDSVLLEQMDCVCYVFDVYLNKTTFKVWLVDINEWSPITDSLLFEWEMLEKQQNFEFRLVESSSEANFHSRGQYSFSTNRLPIDAFQMQQLFQSSDYASSFQ